MDTVLNFEETCPVCGTQTHQLWSTHSWPLPSSQKLFRFAECPNCECLFASPRPTAEELADFYANDYGFDWFEQHLPFKKTQGWHRWQRVQTLVKKYGIKQGRMLDIGCGHGLFLRWAKKAGWDAVGIDFPSLATAYARKNYGLNIIETDLVQANEQDKDLLGKFDLITTWHCLEHTADPTLFLAKAKSLLKPGGKILIAVPNAASPGMRLMRENWVWCQQPFVHTIQFTPNGLCFLAKRIGLSCLSNWSRDTWDANDAMDGSRHRTFERLHGALARRSKFLGFWFYESIRLLCYLVGGFKHWGLGRESAPEAGAELLLLAELKRQD